MPENVLSRRHFLAAGTAAAVAVATCASLDLRKLPGLDRYRPLWLDFADLEPLRGERVRLIAEGGPTVNARVVDLVDHTRTDHGVTVHQYSLLMRTGLREPLEQYTFCLEHPEWGRCTLFCSAVLTLSRGVHYEAIISRLDA
jgi:hypothetical protein